jgi:hypothetical protein
MIFLQVLSLYFIKQLRERALARNACYNLYSPAHNRGNPVISSEGEFRIN